MERLRKLNLFQKILISLLLAMVLVFAIIYPKVIAREGILYKHKLLVRTYEGANTVYSGKVDGKQVRFVVLPNGSLGFLTEDKTYGPYTAVIDPSAAPETDFGVGLTGVVLYCGDEEVFRGGYFNFGDGLTLFNADGSMYDAVLSPAPGMILTDENGNEIAYDSDEPSVSAIINILLRPKLTHNGDMGAWLGGTFICALAIVSMLFADDLFKWGMSFRIRRTDNIEPSDWEIASRYLSWIALTVIALMIFIVGVS